MLVVAVYSAAGLLPRRRIQGMLGVAVCCAAGLLP